MDPLQRRADGATRDPLIRGDDWVGVEIDVWTREEGRADLTLELELSRNPDGSRRAEFRNLHVM